MWKRLGDLLIDEGLITEEQIQKAIEVQKEKGGRLGSILVQLGFVTDAQITEVLGKQYGVPTVDLEKENIDPEVSKLIPPQVAQKFQVVPVKREGKELYLAMANPVDVYTIEDIKFITGYDIIPMVASENMIAKAIERIYGISGAFADVLEEIEDDEEIEVIEDKEEDVFGTAIAADAPPVVKLVNSIITEAVTRGASDIHIEPFERLLRVRYRIDGALVEAMSPQYTMGPALVSRIKIMSNLDISERRLPQDGRIRMKVKDKTVDLRVSTLPVVHGEKIVIRISEKENFNIGLEKLGFNKVALKHFLHAISRPNGVVLVTGPTGSGKSTTLYSALSRLNTPEVNIVTAEDPVENEIMGVNQVQVREEIGYTFAKALRAFLRQDPNIIMVGEIRDKETAEIAIRASLTGHLVLSTLHTNDTATTISRLADMGVAPYLVASSLNLVEAQRLVRRVCEKCKEPITIPYEEFIKLGVDPKYMRDGKYYKGAGCPHCNFTGYKGRVGIYEVMPITPTIRRMIVEGASADELRAQAIKEGMITLRQDALMKLKAGITTIEEITRETV